MRNGRLRMSGGKSLARLSQPEQPPDGRGLVEGHLRECYGRVVYAHKTHEKCADILLKRLGAIKLWQIGLSSITTGSFIAAIFGTGSTGAVIGVVVSTVLLVLNAYTKNYDLGELAQKHRQAAADLWFIREKYLALITDLRVGKEGIEKITNRRDALLEDLHSVYSGAPSTTFKAYRKAQEALKRYEEMTFSDAEIDALLPRELRKNLNPDKGCD